MKLSSNQAWALTQVAIGGASCASAGAAEQHCGGATYRSLVKLGLIVEVRGAGGVRMVALTDKGRAMIARAA